MRAISLNSGSNGNCFYFESEGVRLIVEAGLNCKQYESRLEQIGVSPAQIDAILVSHEHQDHIAGSGVIHRKYGTPVYMTKQTAKAMPSYVGAIADLRTYEMGGSFSIGGIAIQTVMAQHDCAGGVHYILSDGHLRAGVIIDAGAPNNIIQSLINAVDILFLESNYDSRMLQECKYPEKLKGRIRGGFGHLSNLQAAQMVRYYASEKLKYLVLCHISEQANLESLVLMTHNRLHRGEYEVSLAPRDAIGKWVGCADSLVLRRDLYTL